MNKKQILGCTLTLSALGLAIYYLYPEQRLAERTKIDALLVYKSKRKMLAYHQGQYVKTYTISLGQNPIGTKEFEGDKKTPEGIYYINAKNPNSSYHKNLGISYPNPQDIQNADRMGKAVGGDVKIHGLRNGKAYIGKFQRWTDWTWGCIAVTNEEIDELYKAVVIGATIDIRP